MSEKASTGRTVTLINKMIVLVTILDKTVISVLFSLHGEGRVRFEGFLSAPLGPQ
jgi:hypothetical protein